MGFFRTRPATPADSNVTVARMSRKNVAPPFQSRNRPRTSRKSAMLRRGWQREFRSREIFRIAEQIERDVIWRRGWDSNPRAGYPTRRFRGAPVTTTSVPLRRGGTATRRRSRAGGTINYTHVRSPPGLARLTRACARRRTAASPRGTRARARRRARASGD